MFTIERIYNEQLESFATCFGLHYTVDVIICEDYPVNIKTITIITDIGLN